MSGLADKWRELDVVCVVIIALVTCLSPIIYFEMNMHYRLDKWTVNAEKWLNCQAQRAVISCDQSQSQAEVQSLVRIPTVLRPVLLNIFIYELDDVVEHPSAILQMVQNLKKDTADEFGAINTNWRNGLTSWSLARRNASREKKMQVWCWVPEEQLDGKRQGVLWIWCWT